MTVWLYAVENGAFVEVAEVRDGEVVGGDAGVVEAEFPDGVPDEEVVARAFDSVPLVASTDFEVDWGEPEGSEIQMSDDGDRSLVTDATPDWDRHFLSMLTDSAWADSTDRSLIADSGVPEMVQTRIREAIMGGALFSEFDTIPSDKLASLRTEFVDMLDHDGWTTDDLVDSLQEFEPSLSDSEAEVIARTETASVVNTAREEAYEDRGLEDARFKWVGTDEDGTSPEHRTTRACGWLKEQTNPEFGGEPVSMERLKELIREAPTHDDEMQSGLARPDNYVVHPNERHTWVRHVE